MDLLQIFRMNVEAIQCKRRSLAYSRQSADMTARKLSLRNLGFHDVASLKSHEHRLACSMRPRKAVLIGSAHPARAMPRRFDLKRLNILDFQLLRRALSDAGGVYPMRFRQLPLCSIEFGQTARTRFNRQTETFQAVEERPPCRIDGGGVFQGSLRLSLDARKINAAKL